MAVRRQWLSLAGSVHIETVDPRWRRGSDDAGCRIEEALVVVVVVVVTVIVVGCRPLFSLLCVCVLRIALWLSVGSWQLAVSNWLMAI